MRLLPAIVSLCRDVPLKSLELHSRRAAGYEAGYEAISAAQLGPLAALQRLPSLALLGVDSLGQSLAGTLRQLTALTCLRLATEHEDGPVHWEVFDAAAALTQLEELYITGGSRTKVQRLPDGMSRLQRLRTLQVHGIRMLASRVLNTLTSLQRLEMLLPGDQLPMHDPRLQNPLPPGMHALRSLRDLRVTCCWQPMPALALPQLTELLLDAPAFGGTVSPVLSRRPACCPLVILLLTTTAPPAPLSCSTPLQQLQILHTWGSGPARSLCALRL